MKNNVVKNKSISELLDLFSGLLYSDSVLLLSRIKSTNFTRNRKMTFRDIILYYIFRNSKNSDKELTRFYYCLDKIEQRISKQALYIDLKKLNPNVFRYIFKEFAAIFYKSDLSRKYKGYTLLAEDGTFLEIPYSIKNIYSYNFIKNRYVKEIFDVKKVISKASGLYDVTNGIFLDFMLRPAPYSEIPLAFQHLYKCGNLLANQKVIYLADRYYGSVELISFLEYFGFDFCIRGKSNFFKKQISKMKSDDEWITVYVDERWQKRFGFSPEALEIRKKCPELKIRVVKFKTAYRDQIGKIIETDITYFTSLSENEFSKEDIIELYSHRWTIEVSYKTLKTEMEIERHISETDSVAQCCIYGKIMRYNILGIMMTEVNTILSAKPGKHRRHRNENGVLVKYDGEDTYYKVNISQLINLISESNLFGAIYYRKKALILKKVKQIVNEAVRLKVPIRPNRHNQRWGRIVISGYYYRFSLDGRNFPKIKTIKGVMRTVAP